VREILFVASASDFVETDLADTLKLQVGWVDGDGCCWSDPPVWGGSGRGLP
jgi:hypothetical protein